MKEKRILVVDEEQNIRLTIKRALETHGITSEEAVNGEDALIKIQQRDYDLILLDLKMPGMDGMEVLRRLRERGSSVRVVIITAHGTVDNAVEAMKLGAIDFIQKPFPPDQIRQVVSQALRRGTGFLHRFKPVPGENRKRFRDAIPDEEIRRIKAETGGQDKNDHEFCLEQAKAAVEARDFDSAEAWAQKAIAVEPGRPEGFNFLGVFCELHNDQLQAQKYYRAAIALDPTYRPAQNNLYRSTGRSRAGTFDLGGTEEKSRRRTGFWMLLGKREPSKGHAK